MSSPGSCVIVGASLAGATTALTLRELGFDGDVVLVGDEPELPYERPALSKEYLLGTMAAEQLQVRPQQTYDDVRIDLRIGTRATGLDAASRHVLLDGGECLRYSTVVIATGASNVRPPIPGLELPGVHQLRTLADAAVLRTAAEQAHRAVVVGMGFIGCEVAASLCQLGVEVTAVDALAGPLLPQLGAELSARVRSWHEEHGVHMLFGSSVSHISPSGSQLAVATTSGERLSADLVVVGVGARPNVDWLASTPLHVPTGVPVTADCVTDQPDVYAVGDVAAALDLRTGRHRRMEHWSNAIEQGRVAAHAIVGLPSPPRPAPYFWSAQYGHYLQYVGEHNSSDRLVVREAAARLTAFYVDGDVIVAAVTIDNGRELRHARGLLGRSVDVRELADSTVDLKHLARV